MAPEYRVLAFIFLSIFLMVADNRFNYLNSIRFGLAYATTPIYWIADTPARISFWIDDVFVSRTDLVRENEELREELLLSQRELQLLESLASENNRLLALRESSRDVEGDVLPAEIINIAPDPYSRRILIDKGARHNAFVGQALLDANGLMGQVVEVLPFTSWVMLITDPHHVTPVEVNRNGERALARGSRENSDELTLEFVTHTQDMLAGDLLVSSGMGQVYPKNYPVAKVTSVFADPGQPFSTITARPLANMGSTRHVMLVFNEASQELESPLNIDSTFPKVGDSDESDGGDGIDEIDEEQGNVSEETAPEMLLPEEEGEQVQTEVSELPDTSPEIDSSSSAVDSTEAAVDLVEPSESTEPSSAPQ